MNRGSSAVARGVASPATESWNPLIEWLKSLFSLRDCQRPDGAVAEGMGQKAAKTASKPPLITPGLCSIANAATSIGAVVMLIT